MPRHTATTNQPTNLPTNQPTNQPTTNQQPPQPPHKAQTGCSRFVQVTFCCAFMMLTAGVDTATAAARRRQRRLRSWLRHERMTVAMTLAEMSHHTAPRGPKMARVWEGVEHEQHDGLRAQKPPLPGVRPAVSLTPGRSGVTAPCGTPQGTLLSWWCRRCAATTASTTPPSVSSSSRTCR